MSSLTVCSDSIHLHHYVTASRQVSFVLFVSVQRCSEIVNVSWIKTSTVDLSVTAPDFRLDGSAPSRYGPWRHAGCMSESCQQMAATRPSKHMMLLPPSLVQWRHWDGDCIALTSASRGAAFCHHFGRDQGSPAPRDSVVSQRCRF